MEGATGVGRFWAGRREEEEEKDPEKERFRATVEIDESRFALCLCLLSTRGCRGKCAKLSGGTRDFQVPTAPLGQHLPRGNPWSLLQNATLFTPRIIQKLDRDNHIDADHNSAEATPSNGEAHWSTRLFSIITSGGARSRHRQTMELRSGKQIERTPATANDDSNINRNADSSREENDGPQEQCWRCQMLELPCNGGSPCRKCSTDGVKEDFKCIRGTLRDMLQNMYPRIPGLGSSKWILPAIDNIALEVQKRHHKPSKDIPDIDVSTAWKSPNRRCELELVLYVRQFHQINARWENWFDSITDGIIEQCAKIQEDIILEARYYSKPLTEEDLLIASTFRVLNLVHDITKLGSCLQPRSKLDFIGSSYLESEAVTRSGDNLTILVSRCEAPKPDQGVDISSLIQNIVAALQRLLLRGQPPDWPTAFCTLSLLKLVEGQLVTFVDFDYIDGFNKGPRVLHEVWKALCQLYDTISRGNNPLKARWDGNAYVREVGGMCHAPSHFEALNELWTDEGTYPQIS
ncbi:hypothetical protein G7Y89_g2789 [Cudoniella acicularis]|uniref:Uncharacterized protein n=1 Tax=Cudoniella acicularis TaxID=354080 RepID=A0A8H4W8B4_9HELO|nr:hypothetical protein G7Y89_g2789 [Cudoniella acicularis]